MSALRGLDRAVRCRPSAITGRAPVQPLDVEVVALACVDVTRVEVHISVLRLSQVWSGGPVASRSPEGVSSLKANMTLTDRIEIDPEVMLGKPVIRGTRIPVELILRKLSEGASEADLMDAYPRLTREDIQAAMRYAADTLAHEEVVFIGKGTAGSKE